MCRSSSHKIYKCMCLNATDRHLSGYRAKICGAGRSGPLESFGSIARKFGADAAELKKFNGGEVYASRTIYVP